MHIEREALITELEMMRAGLSPKEIIEQSSCYVFKDGYVMTYNDEIACRMKSLLPINGAVQAGKLLEILNKLPTESIEVEVGEGEFLISAKSRKVAVRMEAEVLLPIDTVERPTKADWKKLPEDFEAAVSIVSKCAGKDESKFDLTCVNVTPKWVEACDNMQLARFPLKMDISASFLVRSASVKHISNLGMVKYAETPNWFHFKSPIGLVMSCRRTFVDTYPKLTPLLKVEGELTTIPKGIAAAADCASVFSKENADNSHVMIELSPKEGGRMRIAGEGTSGWYREVRKISYTGPAMRFRIDPDMLIALTEKHNECVIANNMLKVDTGRYVYVTSLGKVEE